MLNLEVDSGQLQRLVDDLTATEKQAEKALGSTVTRMATWLRTKSLRGLSAELSIQQKIIRRRLKQFKVRRSAGSAEITVWYGLDPIAMIYLGARKAAGGVRASGGRFVDGGFIANGRNGSRQVFKRRGRARLPLDKQNADIKDKADTYIEDNLLGSAEFEAQFFKVFERELKWRTQTRR
jgi:hypothetical protein